MGREVPLAVTDCDRPSVRGPRSVMHFRPFQPVLAFLAPDRLRHPLDRFRRTPVRTPSALGPLSLAAPGRHARRICPPPPISGPASPASWCNSATPRSLEPGCNVCRRTVSSKVQRWGTVSWYVSGMLSIVTCGLGSSRYVASRPSYSGNTVGGFSVRLGTRALFITSSQLVRFAVRIDMSKIMGLVDGPGSAHLLKPPIAALRTELGKAPQPAAEISSIAHVILIDLKD